MVNIAFKPLDHHGNRQIALYFNYDEQLKEIVKKAGCTFSQTNKCWYIENTKENFNRLYESLKGKAWIDLSELKNSSSKTTQTTQQRKSALSSLSPEAEEQVITFEQWMQSKRYSRNTIKTYKDAIRTFLRYHSDKPVHEINEQDLIKFNNQYILKNGYSASFQNQVINAIKLFYQRMEKRSLKPEDLHRPKREKRLPNVISNEEVGKFWGP